MGHCNSYKWDGGSATTEWSSWSSKGNCVMVSKMPPHWSLVFTLLPSTLYFPSCSHWLLKQISDHDTSLLKISIWLLITFRIKSNCAFWTIGNYRYRPLATSSPVTLSHVHCCRYRDLLAVHWSCQTCPHLSTFVLSVPSVSLLDTLPATLQGCFCLLMDDPAQRGFSGSHYQSILR